jgi:hypothetical protein
MSAALVLMVCVPGLALFYGGIAPEDHAGSSGEARARFNGMTYVRGETDSARPQIQGRRQEGGDWIS